MRLGIALVLVCACGRVAFDGSGDAGQALAITMPAANAEVMATATLSGTCLDGLPILLSGSGLGSPSSTTCVAGAFSVLITFTDGTGTKTIVVSQGGASVTRTFVRVASVVTPHAAATGVQPSAGFTIDCDLVIAHPPNAVAGDLLVGVIYTDGGGAGSVATPGFTRLMLDGPMYVAFYKVAAATEPNAYTFHIVAGTGGSDTCESAGALVAFANVDPTAPIAAQSANVDSNDPNVVALGVTAPVGGLLVGAWGSNGPATGFEAPAGMMVDGSNVASPTAGFANALLAWQAVPAGVTGDRMATLASTAGAAAALIVLRPKP